jgi:hypothetical protein
LRNFKEISGKYAKGPILVSLEEFKIKIMVIKIGSGAWTSLVKGEAIHGHNLGRTFNNTCGQAFMLCNKQNSLT